MAHTFPRPNLSKRVLSALSAHVFPKQIRIIRVQDQKRLGPATTLYATVALSFVIPTGAEGPAVPRTHRGMFFDRA
jgi:hypothetical protein